MKKITTLMVMLVCCVFSALAQTVAGTATDPSNIKEGYYVLQVKQKSANFATCAYANSFNAENSDNDLVGKALSKAEDYKCVYYVQAVNGKLRIKTAFTDNWWQSASGSGNAYRPQQFEVGTSPTDFEYEEDNGWYFMKTQTTERYGFLNLSSRSKSVYVTCNSGNKLGYWDNATPADNTAEFKFYAVRIQQPVDLVSTLNEPKWFYIVSNGDAPVVLSSEKQNNYSAIPSSKGYVSTRNQSESVEVNDIVKDLWCVTQNSNGSYNLYNRYVGQSLNKYSTEQEDPYFCNAYSAGIFNGVTGCDILPLSDGTYVFKAYNKDYDNTWTISGTTLKRANVDNAISFAFVEPTFTFPMYPVGSNTYNSFAAPFDVALADAEGAVKMYKGTADYENKELVLSQVDAAPANAGVVLIGENCSDKSVTLKVVSGAQSLEGNDLVGTTVEIAAADLTDKLIFGVSDQTNEVGFYSANSSVTALTANHAYLNKTNAAVQTLSMRFNGQPTSIGHVNADNKAQGDASIYDLTGRKVNHTVKGQLYIQNGRKFIAQ